MMEQENNTCSRSDIKQLLDHQLQNIINVQHGLQHQLYQQIEACISIYSMLDLQRPLPPMRGWAASPDFLALLLGEIIDRKPGLVCELGSGTSTIITGYALQKQNKGKLVSIDHEQEYLEKTARQIQLHGLDDYIELIHAPLTDCEINGSHWKWYDLEQINLPEGIEILVIDGPPGGIQPRSRYPALPLLMDHLAGDAVVFLDDAARPDEKAIVSDWLQAFPEFCHESVNCEKGAAVLHRSGLR